MLTPEDGTNMLSPIVGKNYHYLLYNNPEEHSSHLLEGRSLKSHTVPKYLNLAIFANDLLVI